MAYTRPWRPGVTLPRLNAALAAYGRKIGPYLASETTCTIGSVMANNSSGLACGTAENTYQTIDSLCCTTPLLSKGMESGYADMQHRTLASVVTATRYGALPLVCDASSCTEGLIKMLRDAAPHVTVLDATQFTADHVIPKLPEHRRIPSPAVYPTCSSTQLELDDSLLALAQEVAEGFLVPQDWGCCAVAGDRGMLHPELTASATASESTEVQALGTTAHASCNRTCEVGMARATGYPYRHVLEWLAELVTEQCTPQL